VEIWINTNIIFSRGVSKRAVDKISLTAFKILPCYSGRVGRVKNRVNRVKLRKSKQQSGKSEYAPQSA